MKTTSRIVTLGLGSSLFLLPSPEAHAQVPARHARAFVSHPASPPTSSPSWTFIVETKTQWLFVIQDTGSMQDAANFENRASSMNQQGNRHEGGNSKENSGLLTEHSKNSPNRIPGSAFSTNPGAGKGEETGSSKPTVFEGNTNDVPLEGPPAGGPLKPIKPSAPAS